MLVIAHIVNQVRREEEWREEPEEICRLAFLSEKILHGWWIYCLFLMASFLYVILQILKYSKSTQARPLALTTLCLPMEVFVSLPAVILTSYPRQRSLECNQGRGLLLFLAGEVGDNAGQHSSSQGHKGHGGQGPHHSYVTILCRHSFMRLS